MSRILLLCLFATLSAGETQGLTKADITMAVMDGVGGALNGFAQRIGKDWEDILSRLPGMTPPSLEADADDPLPAEESPEIMEGTPYPGLPVSAEWEELPEGYGLVKADP